MRKPAHNRIFAASLVTIFAAVSVPIPLAAQDVQEDEYEEDAVIVVTSTRIRQGGAQDIKHFRTMAAAELSLPRPDSLTVEGLMGEHDLSLYAEKGCNQLFCLVGHAMEANLPTRPKDELFVGLGFASNIDGDKLQREPLNLMAVVDRSGSMEGEPIAAVKAALRQIVSELGDQDRLGIAIYGSSSLVHQKATPVKGNKRKLLAAIESIEIDGSTNMEEGLKLGYDEAFKDAPKIAGKTRLMLFTDEQPNTGNTDPASFMGMAEQASRRGIGLTTIGVGVQYDGDLATKISSVRGGNVFFINDEKDATTTLHREFRNMVSEVAHDVTITMAPRQGYSISGVFGVPDGLMRSGNDGAITVTVPTAFLSSNGGGIYASMGKETADRFLPATDIGDEQPLLNVSLSYVSAIDGQHGKDRITVAPPTGKGLENLELAHALVDEFLVIDAASRVYHEKGDAKAAFHLLNGLEGRLSGTNNRRLKPERKLVATMRAKAAYFAGYSGEMPTSLKPAKIVGEWRVMSHAGVDGIARGDILEFTDEGELITYYKRPRRGEDEKYQDYQANERQINVPDGKLTLNYRFSGDRMILKSDDQFINITLLKES